MLTVCTYWSTHGSCFLLWPDPLVKPHLGQRGLHTTLHHALKSAVDQRTLLIAVEQDPLWNDFFYTELTTGLRLGKICGLMWSDFDERKGVVNIRPNTQMSYERRIYQHIIPALGDIQLDRLTTGDIQQFYTNLKKGGRLLRSEVYGEGLSDQTVRGIHTTLTRH